MENDFYTVLVISTIHSLYGSFSPEVRLQHTLECLESIHKKIPNVKILFVDNSSMPIPEEYAKLIKERVTVFHQLEHNLFSLVANRNVGTKSESEANMMYTALGLLKKHNLLGKRIFKISGRYKISDSFDISEYENPEMKDKYTFVVRSYVSSDDNYVTRRKTMWLEQALVSFAPSLVDEYRSVMPSALGHMRRTGECIEETLFYYIPHENIFPVEKAHVEGMKAEDREKVNH